MGTPGLPRHWTPDDAELLSPREAFPDHHGLQGARIAAAPDV